MESDYRNFYDREELQIEANAGWNLEEARAAEAWQDHEQQAIASEQRERLRNRIWRTKEGKTMHFSQMRCGHIKNSIARIERGGINLAHPEAWIRLLNQELQTRNKNQ